MSLNGDEFLSCDLAQFSVEEIEFVLLVVGLLDVKPESERVKRAILDRFKAELARRGESVMTLIP